MNQPCHIELLGGLKIRMGDRVISRFRTQKTAALLAYLAHYLEQTHAREEIVELLWPDDEIENGQRSLRVALASLRGQLEPPGTPFNSVLVADRRSIQLNKQVVSTDTAAFEAAVKSAVRIEDAEGRAVALKQAADLYRGPFLPGFYDDWAIAERERLEQVYLGALERLPAALAATGDPAGAIDYAHRRVTIDPLSEEAHCALIRLLVEAGQADAARSRFEEMARIFRSELGVAPPRAAQALVEALPAARAPRRSSVLAEVDRLTPAPPPPFPAPLETPARRSDPRLPLTLTPFFGRETELSTLNSHLSLPQSVGHAGPPPRSRSRLVTLTGPGGAGKTRLAVEAARGLADAYGGRVWFVPLAEVHEPGLIADAVLRAMGLPRDPAVDAADQLPQALGPEPALLVLDNFEQLAETGAPAVWTLLEQCAGVICLVTSRQRLDLPGERAIPVAPLAVPASPGTPERLVEFPSVSLFLDRAQAARPDFQITRDNAAAVAALCERLEGIPLAIELAAAWAGILTPSQMLSRLEERLSFLQARRKGSPERQRSLRGAIAWSYNLLTPEQQRFFARLSVFRGGWTLDAAEAVCDEPHALELLQGLHERSLVVTDESGSDMRYRMLETLREYASERLAESEIAGEAIATRGRHLGYFLALAEEAGNRMGGVDQSAMLETLEREHDNLRAALELSRESQVASRKSARSELGTRDAEIRAFDSRLTTHDSRLVMLGLRLAVALTPFWEARGYLAEGRRWLDHLLASSKEDRSLWRARALGAAGTLAWQQADYAAARTLLEQSLSIRRELDDPGGVAAALNTLANVLADQSDYPAARAHYEESLRLRRELDDRRGVAGSLNNLAIVALELEDYAASRVRLEESLAIRRELGDRRGVGNCLNNLGDLAWREGDNSAARPLYEEALGIRRQLGDRRGIASSLLHLANLAVCEGDAATAGPLFAESLEILRGLGDRRAITGCLEEIARLVIRQGRPETAARLFGAAEHLRDAMNAPLPPVERERHDRDIDSLRSVLPAGTFEKLWRAGREMSMDEAVELAVPALASRLSRRANVP